MANGENPTFFSKYEFFKYFSVLKTAQFAGEDENCPTAVIFWKNSRPPYVQIGPPTICEKNVNKREKCSKVRLSPQKPVKAVMSRPSAGAMHGSPLLLHKRTESSGLARSVPFIASSTLQSCWRSQHVDILYILVVFFRDHSRVSALVFFRVCDSFS